MDGIRTIEAEGAPEAIGPYSHAAVADGPVMHTSGQIGIDAQTGELVDGIEAQTTQVISNLEAVLAAENIGFDRVVKTTVYLTDLGNYVPMNDIYARAFPHKPARSCVEVSGLPKGALVEIECIASLPN